MHLLSPVILPKAACNFGHSQKYLAIVMGTSKFLPFLRKREKPWLSSLTSKEDIHDNYAKTRNKIVFYQEKYHNVFLKAPFFCYILFVSS